MPQQCQSEGNYKHTNPHMSVEPEEQRGVDGDRQKIRYTVE